MTENEALLKQAEGLATLRRALHITQAVAYTGWMGSKGLEYFNVLNRDVLHLIGAVCLPLWLVSLAATLMAMAHVRRHPVLASVTDDERTQGLSAKVFAISYWAMLLAVAVLYMASLLTTVDVRAIAPLLVSVGVAAPSFAYVFIYRN